MSITDEERKEKNRAYYSKYRAEHRDEIRDNQRRYYVRHRERLMERGRGYSRLYRKNNPEKVSECHKTWRKNNIEYDLARQKKWHDEHRAEGIEYNRKYREDNPDKVRDARRLYKKKYPEKDRAQVAKRRAMKHSAPGRGISGRQEQEIFEQYAYHCAYCGRGDVKLEIDHIEQLSKGGAHDIENATASCHSCNASKQEKSLLRFLYDRRQAEIREEM
jgi:hypothetical protein